MSEITVLDLKQLMARQSIMLIDIRDYYQFQLGCIPTARCIPMNFLLMNDSNYLNKADTYYIYCEFGNRSKHACEELLKKGYKVVNVVGGYQEYKASL